MSASISIPLVVAVVVTWKLGPRILRAAGRLLAVAIILLCIAPHAPRPSTTALIVTAAISVAAYEIGRSWDTWRRRGWARARRQQLQWISDQTKGAPCHRRRHR